MQFSSIVLTIGAVRGNRLEINGEHKIWHREANGEDGFRYVKVKMKALLMQYGVFESLKGKEVAPVKREDPNQMMEKAYSTIILYLCDKALHEVAKETTAKDVWDKLEGLYMVKSLANRLFMKQKLYSFKMTDEK